MQRAITNSERSTTACWQRWLWQYGLHLRPTVAQGHFLRGNVWHAAMDAYFDNGLDAGLAEIATRLETSEFGLLAFGRESYALESDDADALARSLSKMLVQYDKRYSSSTYEVTHIEEAIVCSVGGRKFSGKIDKIMRCRETGKRYIMDHKTTSMPVSRWEKYNAYSPQLLGYALLANERFGLKIDSVIHDVVVMPTVREHSIQAPNANGLLRAWAGKSLPNTTPEAWLKSMHLAKDGSEDACSVHRRLIQRESDDVEMARIERVVDDYTIDRLRTELEIVADLIAVHDKPLDSVRDSLLEAFKGEGARSFDQVIRDIHLSHGASYVRNHGECEHKGTCEYMSICKRGEMDHGNQFRVSDTAHEELEDE